MRSKKLQEEKNNQDQDFQVLSIFYYKTEIEIIEAVKRIRDRLKIANGISPTTFGELANYLIAVKPLIDCVNVIDECKQLILTQLQSCENDVRIHIAHHNGIELWEQSQKDEYSEFTKQMLDAINLGNAKQLEFDYTIDDLREFSNRLWDYRNKYSHQNPTIKLKADLLVELLKKCTAYDIHQVRLMLKTNYENPQGITDTTKEEIQDIRNAIEQLLNHNEFDSIQKWQIHWIVNDLNRILESIEG